jgi:hypothetical protein
MLTVLMRGSPGDGPGVALEAVDHSAPTTVVLLNVMLPEPSAVGNRGRVPRLAQEGRRCCPGWTTPGEETGAGYFHCEDGDNSSKEHEEDRDPIRTVLPGPSHEMARGTV